MSIMNFTVEEINFISIYKTGTVATTLQWLIAAVPYMDDDMRIIANNASRKLAKLTEQEFAELSFTLTDDTDEGGEYAETTQENAE